MATNKKKHYIRGLEVYHISIDWIVGATNQKWSLCRAVCDAWVCPQGAVKLSGIKIGADLN